jgi:hypothetical protein
MSECKMEFWWTIKCKSPRCRGNILMGKIADVEPYRFPLGALPPDAPCADWEESCPYCGALHKYSRGDVLSATVDINQAGPGSGSRAFRQAWSHHAA